MLTRWIKTVAGPKPYSPETEAWYQKIKLGEVYECAGKRVRNPRFHRLYFALLNIAYDNWEPPKIEEYEVEKNFDRFRKDVTILAGFYERHFRVDGSFRVEPKSISFASMDETEFSDLYSKTIDVLIKHVYDSDMDKDKLNNIVNEYLNFV